MMVLLTRLSLVLVLALSPALTAHADASDTRAVMVPESGTYSRTISTQSPDAQKFFDQGLRLSWGFYFPESIASYQQASLFGPDHPMPY